MENRVERGHEKAVRGRNQGKVHPEMRLLVGLLANITYGADQRGHAQGGPRGEGGGTHFRTHRENM